MPWGLGLEKVNLGLRLVLVVKPILQELGADFVVDDVGVPRLLIAALGHIGAEVAVADFEAVTEVVVSIDGFVERGQFGHDAFHHRRGDAVLFLEVRFEFVVELRRHVEEGKPTAQGVVHHGQRTVGRVHRPDDVHVFRNGKMLPLLAVGQLHTVAFPTLVRFNEHHQLPKNLGQVSPVDLVNQEEIVAAGVAASFVAEAEKHAVSPLKPSALFGPESLNKVLVAVALVKLDDFNTVLGLLFHQRVRQPLGDVCFPGARRALKDDVLLGYKGFFCLLHLLLLEKHPSHKI